VPPDTDVASGPRSGRSTTGKEAAAMALWRVNVVVALVALFTAIPWLDASAATPPQANYRRRSTQSAGGC
jgi:hypothetical protein